MRLVCDIGGTGIKYGIMTGKREFRAGFPFTDPTPGENLLETILTRLSTLVRDHVVTDVGVAIAANVNDDGIVTHSTNLAIEPGTPLAQILAQRLQLPVFLGNDGNVAALAVSVLPAAAGLDPIVAVTLGTGIGGGIINGGRLVRGRAGAGSELGHVLIEPKGPRCGCGNTGCLESFAGAGAVLGRYNERTDHPVSSVKALSSRMRAGEADAIDTVRDTGMFIGRALVTVSAIIAPQAIFLTGGVAGLGEILRQAVQDELDDHAFLRHMNQVPGVYLVADPYLVLKGAMELAE